MPRGEASTQGNPLQLWQKAPSISFGRRATAALSALKLNLSFHNHPHISTQHLLFFLSLSKVRGRELTEVQLLSLHHVLLLFKDSISLLNLWGLALNPSRHQEKTPNHRFSKYPPCRNAEHNPGTNWEEKLLKTTLRNAIRAKEWFQLLLFLLRRPKRNTLSFSPAPHAKR